MPLRLARSLVFPISSDGFLCCPVPHEISPLRSFSLDLHLFFFFSHLIFAIISKFSNFCLLTHRTHFASLILTVVIRFHFFWNFSRDLYIFLRLLMETLHFSETSHGTSTFFWNFSYDPHIFLKLLIRPLHFSETSRGASMFFWNFSWDLYIFLKFLMAPLHFSETSQGTSIFFSNSSWDLYIFVKLLLGPLHFSETSHETSSLVFFFFFGCHGIFVIEEDL